MAHDRGKKPSLGSLHVRCAEIDDPNCRWEARGHDDAEILKQVEQHGREAHNHPMDNAARNRVRQVLHSKKAA
jgi:predicted small metal-binding protein